MSNRPPDVAVVVPTVDRVALLERCLRGLAAQDGPEFEAIVVHDGNPGVIALLAEWGPRLPLRALQVVERGAAAKRNAGWRASTAAYVAFTDDDCEPAPGWLKAALSSFGDGVDLVQGRVEPHPEDAAVDGPFARTITVTGPSPLFPNANLVYRRSALERTGGFDPRLSAGEDTDLAWRVQETGGAVAWADEALVWHAVRRADLLSHLRSLPRWASLPLVVRRHPQLRVHAHRHVFWKDTHPAALLALVGAVAAIRRPALLALAAPAVARRVRRHGVRHGLQLAAADAAETAVLVAGTVRHREVLL